MISETEADIPDGGRNSTIKISLTREQQKHLLMATGFLLPSIQVRKMRLAALALAAAAAGRDSLPFSRSAATIARMLQSPDQVATGPFLRIVSVPFTEEQSEQLRQLTGRRLSSLLLAPDEYELNCHESWESDAAVIRVGKSFVIVREGGTNVTHPGEHCIVLPDDGSQSVFGTGRHAATQLALVLMEEHVCAGASVVDVGTGSGILAVAACRLGAGSVTALDNEPTAVALAQRTAVLNAVNDRMQVRLGTLTGGGEAYDQVLMNIGAGPIIGLAGTAAELLRPSGIFITSGIAAARAEDVTTVVSAHGFRPIDGQAKGDWRAITFQRTA
jgi:ribosomal protein L11 methyltransferase